MLEAVEAVNDQQKYVLVKKITERYGEDLRSLTFAIWGLAFKPNTDDMREAPSRIVIKELLQRGARLVAYDPVAMPEAKRVLALDFADAPQTLERISFVESPLQAAEGADALVIITEWKAFQSPNFAALKATLKAPVIIDGRNMYEPDIRKQGFEYLAIGR